MEKAEFCVLFSPWFRVLCIFRVLIFALLSLLNMKHSVLLWARH